MENLNEEIIKSYYKLLVNLHNLPGTSLESEITNIEVMEQDGEKFVVFTANGIEEAIPYELYEEMKNIGFEEHINKQISELETDIKFMLKCIQNASGYNTSNVENIAKTFQYNLKRMVETKNNLDKCKNEKCWL